MFLFGEEVGAQKDFIYDQVLQNRKTCSGLRTTTGQFLVAFYGDLIRFRLNHSGLRSRNIDVLYTNNVNRVIVFHRWDDTEDFLVFASLNNQPFDHGYVVQSPRLPGGSWKEVFNSDADRYRGWNVGNFGATIPSAGGTFNPNIPACGFVVFNEPETNDDRAADALPTSRTPALSAGTWFPWISSERRSGRPRWTRLSQDTARRSLDRSSGCPSGLPIRSRDWPRRSLASIRCVRSTAVGVGL